YLTVDLLARRSKNLVVICILRLLRHCRQGLAFARSNQVRRPRLAVELKPVTRMHPATRRHEMRTRTQEYEASFFEYAAGGNIVDAGIGHDTICHAEPEPCGNERLCYFARVSFVPHGGSQDVAKLYVCWRGGRRTDDAYNLPSTRLLRDCQNECLPASVVGTRLEYEPFRFALWVGMRYPRRPFGNLGEFRKARYRWRIRGPRPAQPKPLGLDAKNV